MSNRYRPIVLKDFAALMADMGFSEITITGTYEHVYERLYNNPRFSVRIYSSIACNNSVSRECGADAIRVVLYDSTLDKAVISKNVHRTQNALENTRIRAQSVWAYKNANGHAHWCTCGSLMVPRQSSGRGFLGCSSFPACKNTKSS
jgi:hypothetical protein